MATNIGAMKWYGMGNYSKNAINTTFSGLEFDVAKSALQKYVRRNVLTKALLTTVEIYRLREVGGEAAVSNLCNRLAIIAVEDIGAANISLVVDVIQLLESGTRDIGSLLAIVQLLCASDKTRLMSHCWRSYATTEGRSIASTAGLPLDTTFTAEDLTYIQQYKNCDLFVTSDPDNLRYYILIFLKRLHERNFNAFSWAYFYLETSANLMITRRRKFINGNTRSMTGKPDILLWKALALVLPVNISDILVGAYYNHTENRPFLQCAILTALHEVNYHNTELLNLVQLWRTNDELTKMMNGNYRLVVDDYVIDKHTRLGRLQHKTIKDFVEDGAVVEPQSTIFYNEQLATLYKQR